jgi:glycosyltransferase involved in cell wall biosynthesis
VKLGIIARAEDRGLGIQTWEACRHLNPERVLLVIPPWDRDRQHPDRYNDFDTLTVEWLPGYRLNERTTRSWLSGLDAVYTAETVYDLNLPSWAKEARCKVVVHGNPEMTHRRIKRTPVTWWAPTSWQLDSLPEGARVVPMPVATDRTTTRSPSDRIRFLHVVGRQAEGDRAGTKVVASAVRHLHAPAVVKIRGLDAMPPVRSHSSKVDVDWRINTEPNYWDLYRDVDVLIAPRRYGGLSLPTQEALAAGIPVVMTDCPPNDTWPGPRIPVHHSKPFDCMGGRFDSYEADPEALAAVMTDLATHPATVAELSAEASKWAEANSWEALTPLWMDTLSRC